MTASDAFVAFLVVVGVVCLASTCSASERMEREAKTVVDPVVATPEGFEGDWIDLKSRGNFTRVRKVPGGWVMVYGSSGGAVFIPEVR